MSNLAYNVKHFFIFLTAVNAFKWLLHFLQTHSSKLQGGKYVKTKSPLGQCCISEKCEFLGVYTKLQKVTIRFVMPVCLSVCLSVCPNRTIRFPLERFFLMKFRCLSIFRKSVRKIQVWFKFDKNNGYCTWRCMYIYDHIWL